MQYGLHPENILDFEMCLYHNKDIMWYTIFTQIISSPFKASISILDQKAGKYKMNFSQIWKQWYHNQINLELQYRRLTTN